MMAMQEKLAKALKDRWKERNAASLGRRRRAAVAAVLIGAFLTQPVFSGTRIHGDRRGYTYRSVNGSTTYSYRFDTGATYLRTGDIATYRDRTGTSGVSLYGSQGRYDSYRNAGQGWSGSGYTPYSSSPLTTYTRTNTSNLFGQDDQGGSPRATTALPRGSPRSFGLLALVGGGIGLASWLGKQKARSSPS
jgi:hypothetical protein